MPTAPSLSRSGSVDRREAGRRAGRAGELLAPAGELPPAGDRVLRPGTGRAANRAATARRRVRLRRAVAPGAAADLVGPAEPAQRSRPADDRARNHRFGGRPRVSIRLAKIETAIFRRKTILFEYHTMERDDVGTRKVDPYQLLYQGGQFYLVGRSHERSAIRVFRLSRIQGKVGYATKAEHDFQRPDNFDPRAVREPDRLAVRRPRGCRRGVDLRPDRLAGRAALQALRRDPLGRRRRMTGCS